MIGNVVESAIKFNRLTYSCICCSSGNRILPTVAVFWDRSQKLFVLNPWKLFSLCKDNKSTCKRGLGIQQNDHWFFQLWRRFA